MDGAFVLIPILLFLIGFPVLWCAIVALSGRIGGWHALASQYRFDGEFDGPVWRWQSAQMGLAGYSGVLVFGANKVGLFVRPIWMFSFTQPPLFIPWEDISIRRSRFLFTAYTMEFRRVPRVKMRIYRVMMENISANGGPPAPPDG